MTPSNAAALSEALPAPARRIEYVSIDCRRIEAKDSPFWQKEGEGRFEMPLPGGGTVAVVIDRSEMLGANRFTSTGHVEGEPRSRAVFAYASGFLSATVEISDHTYTLRPATGDVSQWYEIDPALVPPCGGVRHGMPDAAAMAAAVARKSALATEAASTPVVAAATDASQHPEVHVMMVYTQAVKSTLSGAARVAALQSEFDAAIARVNNEFAASQITARVKLVKIVETKYDESASVANKVQDDALTAIASTTDGKMDEIHALRDQVGADLVCLVLGRSDAASIGLSYILDSSSVVDSPDAFKNPQYAFAVVQYATVAGTDVVPHELGHLFGCAHARGDPGAFGPKDGVYTYSYGYRFYGADGRQYHDIMAYSPGSALSYFSNPNLVVPAPVNAPIGVAPGQIGEANCALTIEKTAFELSTFRLQKQGPPTGSLVNVSTRAYVGSGDQVLIAGFVVEGSESKRVLIRAVGPSLTSYGVTDALANPMLHVYGSGRAIAASAAWTLQPNAADIATVTSQVGAFAFSASSGDSASLVTLSPGAYSAVVESATGAPGSGLVEVYDVDRAGNRIVNLSTRAYADAAHAIYGGFVVQGAAGTTKRILVRVLGPTLAQSYGVSGAMYDPRLELHNAAGDLLLKNDDWSSGDAAGVVSEANDFHPQVVIYSETQIAATGFAPSNRREPCVMLDLAPGSYTVVVAPYADQTTATSQSAQAGIALIEAYEINQ